VKYETFLFFYKYPDLGISTREEKNVDMALR